MVYLLIGYAVLFIYRPFEIWPQLAAIRLERVYVLITMVAAFLSGRLRFSVSPSHLVIVVFVLAVLSSWMLSPWGGEKEPGDIVADWLKIVVFYVLATCLVNDRKELFLLLVGFVLAVGIFASHSIYEYFNGRYVFSMGVKRMVGINTVLKHPIALSTTAIMAIPVATFVAKHAAPLWLRLCAIGYLPVAVYAVVQSNARTGIVGLAVLALLYVIRSRYRFRIVAVALIATAVVWGRLDESSKDRIRSIVDSAETNESAQASAETREEHYRMGVELYQANPLLGVGPGAWRLATSTRLSPHNLYGQLLGELGTVGAFAFALVVINCLLLSVSLMRSSRFATDDKEQVEGVFWSDLGFVLVVMLGLSLLFGAGGGTLYRYQWIWITAFATIAANVAFLARHGSVETGSELLFDRPLIRGSVT